MRFAFGKLSAWIFAGLLLACALKLFPADEKPKYPLTEVQLLHLTVQEKNWEIATINKNLAEKSYNDALNALNKMTKDVMKENGFPDTLQLSRNANTQDLELVDAVPQGAGPVPAPGSVSPDSPAPSPTTAPNIKPKPQSTQTRKPITPSIKAPADPAAK